MCCTIIISFFLFEIWPWCLRIKTFKCIIFSIGFYSFRFQGGERKLNCLYVVLWKEKRLRFKVMVLHAISISGKCYSKLKIKTKLILNSFPRGQDAGSVSLSAATTSPTFSSSTISTFLLFFHHYLWVIKEAGVRTIACSWLYKSAAHQRKTFIPRNHSFARVSPGRMRFAVAAAEQRNSLTAPELHGRPGVIAQVATHVCPGAR